MIATNCTRCADNSEFFLKSNNCVEANSCAAVALKATNNNATKDNVCAAGCPEGFGITDANKLCVVCSYGTGFYNNI